jgi:hypothetical protein
MDNSDCPTCDTCGAPITTGFMVFFCPRRLKCEFFDGDAESKRILQEHWAEQDAKLQGQTGEKHT